MFGTRAVRLVFTNGGTLHYVDFSEDSPQIRAFSNVEDAHFPVLSPDGDWVVFNTGVEAEYRDGAAAWVCRTDEPGMQPIKVADMAHTPRFVLKSGDPEVVYATKGWCLESESYRWDGCGSVVARHYSDNAFPDSREIWAGGSYFGGLSTDGRYLATAEQSANAWMLDLQNAAGGPQRLHTLTVTTTSTDLDTTVNLQTCNASISPSDIFTDVMMYYDFGGLRGYEHDLLGEWDMHEFLFITRFDDVILKVFQVPEQVPVVESYVGTGEITHTEWEHPEWSNHPYFAAACVLVERSWHKDYRPGQSIPWQSRKRNERIFGINLKQDRYLELIASNDTVFSAEVNLLHPWIWVEKAGDFVEDSCWLVPTGENCGNAGVVIRGPGGAGRLGMELQGNRLLLLSHPVGRRYGIPRVSIYAPDGAVVHAARVHHTPSTTRVDLSEVGNGSYVVTVRQGGRVFSERCILVR